MKNFLPWVLVLCALVSCTVNRVDRYPGKPVTAFPAEFQGEYKAKASGIRSIFYSKELDSLRIKITSKSIAMLGKKGWENTFTISSKEVLSELNGYYFLSNVDSKEPKYWNTHAMFIDGKELVFFNVAAQENDLKKDKLRNYLPLMLVTRGKGGREEMIPVTEDSVLAKVSNINENSTDSVLYYKMNEEQLMLYIDKEKNPKNTLRFVKIKQATAKK